MRIARMLKKANCELEIGVKGQMYAKVIARSISFMRSEHFLTNRCITERPDAVSLFENS